MSITMFLALPLALKLFVEQKVYFGLVLRHIENPDETMKKRQVPNT
jgi:hypothetical protein